MDSSEEFIKSTQTLGMRYLEEYTRGLQRYSELLNTMARPGGSTATVQSFATTAEQQKRYSEFMLNEAPKVLQQVSAASMNYYTSLADLGIQTMNRYLEHVMNGQAAPSAPSMASDSKPAPLVFHGVAKDKTSNAFLISNHRSTPIDVEFDVAEVVSDDGKSRFKPKARFTPGKCSIGPRSEKVVQCTLTLSDKFKAGQPYRGSIAVVGFPEMSMPFTVDVEAAPAKARATPKKTAARKSKKKTTQKKTAKKPARKKSTVKKKSTKRARR